MFITATIFSGYSLVAITSVIGSGIYNAYYCLCTHFQAIIKDTASKLRAGREFGDDVKTVESKFFKIFKKEFAIMVNHHQLLLRYVHIYTNSLLSLVE